jgi:hypothetical protein
MSIQFFRPLLCMVWVVAMPMVWAQTAAVAIAPEGSVARSAALQISVPLSFKSVMTDYRPYSEQTVGSWADANRTVAQIGGWRAYAKEASQPETATKPSAHDNGVKP